MTVIGHFWSGRLDSNRRPNGYKPFALTTELRPVYFDDHRMRSFLFSQYSIVSYQTHSTKEQVNYTGKHDVTQHIIPIFPLIPFYILYSTHDNSHIIGP